MLRRHLGDHGTTPDGRLFRGARGGMLSESVYGRAWHAARLAALGPDLAATALARRPYDLRHAALSLWLNATGAPAEVAARAGNSARVLHEVYLHCTDGQRRRRQPADRRRPRRRRQRDTVVTVRESERLHEPSAPPRTLSAICPRTGPRPAHSPRPPGPAGPQHRMQTPPRTVFPQLRRHLRKQSGGRGNGRIRPTHSPRNTADGPRNRSLSRQKPVTPIQRHRL